MEIKKVKLNNNQPFVYLSKDRFKEGDSVEIREATTNNKEIALNWIDENKEKIQEAREQLKLISDSTYISPEYQALQYVKDLLNIKEKQDEGIIFTKGRTVINSDYCWDIVESEYFYNPVQRYSDEEFTTEEFDKDLQTEIMTFKPENIDDEDLRNSIDLSYYYELWCDYFKELENSFDNVFKDLGFTEFEHDNFGENIVHKELPIVLNYSYKYDERADFKFQYIEVGKEQYQDL